MVTSVSSTTVTETPSADVFTSPFTSTITSSDVKLIVSRYLSVPLIGIFAVCLEELAVAVPAISQSGSTTSTTVPVPSPPGIFTPDVIVVVM